MFGEAVKRLDRLAPNLVQICGLVREWGHIGYLYNSPLNSPVGFSGVTNSKVLGRPKLSNNWTDWHQIWYTCADSSGNGYTPGVLGVKHSKSLEKLSNGWTDWHQLWFTSADSPGKGHRLNTNRPTIPQGQHFWGFERVTNSNFLGSCQTARLIGTKCGTCLRIRLGMDIAKYNSPLNHRGHFGGF